MSAGKDRFANTDSLNRYLALGAIVPALAMFPAPLSADTLEWRGPSMGTWFTLENWQNTTNPGLSGLPGSADMALIGAPGPAFTTGDASVFYLHLTGVDTTMKVLGGTMAVLNATQLGISVGDRTHLEISGGGTKWHSRANAIGDKGEGTLIVHSGAAVESNVVRIGRATGSKGHLILDGKGSSWSNTDSSFSVGYWGKGDLTIANRATLYQYGLDGIVVGELPLSQGTIHVGSHLDSPTSDVAPGHIEAQFIRFNNGAGKIRFNHNDSTRAYEFKPAVAGAGEIDVVGGATVFTGDSTGFTGPTAIRKDGTLVVKGSLDNSTVDVWGVLAGNGRVGDVNLHGGGRVEPGNSVGTLLIKDNLTTAPGSIFQAEINGLDSDRIDVGKVATVNGSTIEVVHDTDSAVPVLPGKQYTLLTTGGGLVVNQPMGLSVVDFPFLDMALSRDSHNAYLATSRNGIAFASLASTANEAAVAGTLDALGPSNPLWQQVVGARASAASSAFTSLAGGALHANAAGALSAQAHHLRDAVTGRLRQGLGVDVPTTPTLAYAPDVRNAYAAYGKTPFHKAPPLAAIVPNQVFAVWAQGLGNWGRIKGDTNAAAIDHSLGGIVSGLDVTFDNAWRLGVAGGYSQANFNSNAASGSSDSYHLALYGGGQFGPWGLRGGSIFSRHDLSTSRQVAVVNLRGLARGDYTGRSTQVFGEIGHSIVLGQGSIEPFASLAWVKVDNTVQETGLGAVAGKTGLDTTYGTLGMRGAVTVTDTLTVRGTLGWRHAFGDVAPMATLAFQAGGSPFTLAGAPIGRDALVAEAGVDLAVAANGTLGISYSGQVATKGHSHGVKGNLTLRF